MGDSPLGAFELIFDNCIISHIQNSTNVEARRMLLNNEWHVSRSELRAFIALLCDQGAHGGQIIPLDTFWSKQWGMPFFPKTVVTNRFGELLRFTQHQINTLANGLTCFGFKMVEWIY